MARGDFFQSFLQEARELLSAPPRKNKAAEADINIPFQQAALKSTAEDDKLFGNLSIRCRLRPLASLCIVTNSR